MIVYFPARQDSISLLFSTLFSTRCVVRRSGSLTTSNKSQTLTWKWSARTN